MDFKPFFAAQNHFGPFEEGKAVFQALKASSKPFLEKFLWIFLEFLNQILFLKEKEKKMEIKKFFFIPRRRIFFHKTNFRGKLKDSQRVKISYFAFSFIRSQMNLFSKGESIMLCFESDTFPRPFLLEKKYEAFTWNKNLPNFFPTGKTSIFRGLESQGLDMKDWEKLSPPIVRGKLRGRTIGRKFIFQSPWLWNFKATKAPKAFFLKPFWGDSNFHHCSWEWTKISQKFLLPQLNNFYRILLKRNYSLKILIHFNHNEISETKLKRKYQ